MANKKLSSTQAYNEAIKPFIDHKNAYQKYKGTPTAGDIPRTESQEKIEAGQKWQKEWLVDPLTAGPAALWNLGFKDTGWEAGKNNWLLQSKADKAQRKAELEQSKLYRKKRDDEQNRLEQERYDNAPWNVKRQREYPTISELVVALYDEDDKAEIIKRRVEVKAKYPKE